MNEWIAQEGKTLSEWVETNFHVDLHPLWLVFIGLVLIVLLDWVSRNILLRFIRKVISRTRLSWDDSFYTNKVFHSLLHLFPIGVAYVLNGIVFIRYPNTSEFIGRLLSLFLILVFVQLIFRISNSLIEISKDENNYTTIGVRTFGQLIKVLSIFVGTIVAIALLFNIPATQIFTVLTALAAIILLLFRDTILGFVSGVQIASTKMFKVGDWVALEKHNVEGVIKEINLTTVKIENFDKTISAVPTYEFINTGVKNFSPMIRSDRRRIKRSILFNANSLKPLNNEKIAKIETDYPNLSGKLIGLNNSKAFRLYAEDYLRNQAEIDENETLIVRILELSPECLPIEIYCFTHTSNWVKFEGIQSNILEELIIAAKEFDLEVMQIQLPSQS